MRKLVVSEVLPLALGEAKQENRPGAAPIGDDDAKAAALALARTGNALFDESAAQIGINETVFGALHSLTKRLVGDPLTALETRKGFQRTKLKHSVTGRAHS